MSEREVLSEESVERLRAVGLEIGEKPDAGEVKTAIKRQGYLAYMLSEGDGAPTARVGGGAKFGGLADLSGHPSATGSGNTNVEVLADAYLSFRTQVRERSEQAEQ